MKVLSLPDTGEKWAHVFDCSCCKAKLEANRDDVRHTPAWGDMRESGPERFYVVCPACLTREHLDCSKLPDPVKRCARNRASETSGYPYG